MDPNMNLKEQLRITARVRKDANGNERVYPDIYAMKGDLERLAELVEALDAWIQKGGFLPKRWAKVPPPKSTQENRT